MVVSLWLEAPRLTLTTAVLDDEISTIFQYTAMFPFAFHSFSSHRRSFRFLSLCKGLHANPRELGDGAQPTSASCLLQQTFTGTIQKIGL